MIPGGFHVTQNFHRHRVDLVSVDRKLRPSGDAKRATASVNPKLRSTNRSADSHMNKANSRSRTMISLTRSRRTPKLLSLILNSRSRLPIADALELRRMNSMLPLLISTEPLNWIPPWRWHTRDWAMPITAKPRLTKPLLIMAKLSRWIQD